MIETDTEAAIQEATRRLVEAAHPEKIILFGSYARGDFDKDSDRFRRRQGVDAAVAQFIGDRATPSHIFVKIVLEGLMHCLRVVVRSMQRAGAQQLAVGRGWPAQM